MKLTFFQKNKAIAAVLFIILVLETLFIFKSEHTIKRTSEDIVSKDMVMLNLAHEIKLSVVQVQQWLTDISATRGLDGLNDGFDEASKNAEKFKKLIAEISALDPENLQQYQKMSKVFDAYYLVGKKMAQAYVDDGPSAGNVMMGDFDKEAAQMTSQIESFLTAMISRAKSKGETQLELIRQLSLITIVASVAMTLALVFAFFQGRALLKFLGNDPETLKQVVDDISEGVLTNDSFSHSSEGVYGAILSLQKRLSSIIEKDIQTIIDDAVLGNFDKNIVLDDKPGFYKTLGASINTLLETCQHITADTARIFASLEQGDLSQIITREYQGAFDQLKHDANATIKKIQRTIETDIQNMVTATSRGNLDQRIDLSDKQGFFKEISQGINQLAETTSSFFNDLNFTLDQVSKGNLLHPIEQNYSGRFNEIKLNLNQTISQLDEVVSKLNLTTDVVASASVQISAGNGSLSSRTESQASALDETATSIEALSNTVSNNAANTVKANQLAVDTQQSVKKGNEVMQKTSQAMEDINYSSQKIAEIIGVIDEIAFQTNLLALNASVEAARAGEQGRGFAVVATEVRNLAGRSATAAREIKELIVDSVQKVDTGVKLVSQSFDSQAEIAQNISQVETIISEISISSQDQSKGIEEVKSAIISMEDITQQNAALAEQTSAAAITLAQNAEDLSKVMNFFTNKGKKTEKASTASPLTKHQISPENRAKSKSDFSKSTRNTVNPVAKINAEDEWEEF